MLKSRKEERAKMQTHAAEGKFICRHGKNSKVAFCFAKITTRSGKSINNRVLIMFDSLSLITSKYL
jgi:hypothetical protein